MNDLIDRTKLIRYIKYFTKINGQTPIVCTVLTAIKYYVEQMPSVDAAPVQYGHWVLEREPNGNPYCFHCSVCDDDFHIIGIKSATKYCPNCGAKMDYIISKEEE